MAIEAVVSEPVPDCDPERLAGSRRRLHQAEARVRWRPPYAVGPSAAKNFAISGPSIGRHRVRRCSASRSQTRCPGSSPSASRRSSAVLPVQHRTRRAGLGSPVPAAVPLVVTLAIIARRSATRPPGSRDGGSLSSGAPCTSRGERTTPLSIAAATWAMPSGEKLSRPCPIASAARRRAP